MNLSLSRARRCFFLRNVELWNLVRRLDYTSFTMPITESMSVIGAGTGIVSLTFGALRSAKTTHADGCIFATDLGKSSAIFGDLRILTTRSQTQLFP